MFTKLHCHILYLIYSCYHYVNHNLEYSVYIDITKIPRYILTTAVCTCLSYKNSYDIRALLPALSKGLMINITLLLYQLLNHMINVI